MPVALTGGVACGKSTAAAEFAKLGWKTLSADALAHEVLDTPEVTALVRGAFGTEVFPEETGWRVCRRALGRIVFADPAARRTLETLIHPRVNALWRARLAAAAPGERWLVEIPLLFETGLETEFATILCVHCTPAVQFARLAARGHAPEDCRARLAAQLSVDEKVCRSTHALFNDGAPAFLAAQIRHLAPALRE